MFSDWSSHIDKETSCNNQFRGSETSVESFLLCMYFLNTFDVWLSSVESFQNWKFCCFALGHCVQQNNIQFLSRTAIFESDSSVFLLDYTQLQP